MSDLERRPVRGRHASSASSAPTVSCWRAAPPASSPWSALVLAAVGVIGFGIPVLAAVIAVLCFVLLKRATS